ncbi:hypothetical protein PENTCL1PPCAC_21755 [Pristionchus entomophagus]|uniref:Uncharacterized protein n=1 Tax=Pristionchus entomophagus TaxID=358040 RepID=A0AAV5TYF5_9BILA|nr:hypothetical protein PENTCL1PPCAC_21755 [Pristionchus entomophagus]
MDVARLLDTRAREILCEAILKEMEVPSEVESRAARDDAKKSALRAEAKLDTTMKKWTDTRKQLENYKDVIDPAQTAAARELDEQRSALRVQAASLRQAMEAHGIDREEFGRRMDENDVLDADIGQLLRTVEGAKENSQVIQRVKSQLVVSQKQEEKKDEESVETSDVEMQ